MFYDLTHSINNHTSVYPGDPKVSVEPAGELERDGFFDHKLTFGTHVGTHIDAPAHMLKDGKQLKDYPPERFILDAVCLDAQDGFKAADITTHAKPGMAVLFYTGASEYFHEERYWHEFMVLDEKSIKALRDKKVSLVGLDTGSADKAEDFPIHKALLGADILIIENMTNLGELVGKTFKLYALPLKLEKDGAPIRAVANTGLLL